MTRRHLAFTGPFADINFGDYAMLVNNVLDLNPSSTTIFAYNSSFVERIRRDYLTAQDVEIVDVEIDGSFVLQLTDGYIPTPLDVLNAITNREDVWDSLATVDTLVVNGGGYLNELWAQPHRIERLVQIFAPAIVASFRNVRIVFTGNGIGPLGASEELLFALINALENPIFAVRDSVYSPQYLRRLGVSPHQILEVPDDLYLLNPALRRRAATSSPAERYVAIETYLPVDYLRSHLRSIKYAAQQIVGEYGLQLHFLPLHVGAGGMEQAIFLADHLPSYSYHNLDRTGYLPIEDAYAVAAGSSMVLSTRYHAFVLGLSAGTPVVNALRDVVGDKRYYFGKAFGALRRAMPTGSLDPRLYLSEDWAGALSHVARNFDSIVTRQRNDFEQYLQAGRTRAADARLALIERILQ